MLDAFGAVAVLGDDDVHEGADVLDLDLPLEVGAVHPAGVGLRLRLLEVVDLAEGEEDRVGVLLDGSGLPQVRQLGPLIISAFDRSVQLAQQDDRDLGLPGQGLQGSSGISAMALASFRPARAGRFISWR